MTPTEADDPVVRRMRWRFPYGEPSPFRAGRRSADVTSLQEAVKVELFSEEDVAVVSIGDKVAKVYIDDLVRFAKMLSSIANVVRY